MATGACAGLILIAWLYTLCLAVTPAKMYASLRSVPHIVAIGAALAVMWFWYSLRLHVPASTSAKVLFVLTIALIVFRRRAVCQFFDLKRVINRDSLFWIGLYVIFYSANYIFTLPPVTHDRLPIVRIFNNDIFNYINIAQYLQHLGPSNIAGFSFIQPLSTMVEFTPSAFDIINGFAVFFNAETMRAAMPAIFSMAALGGCCITWIITENFKVPRFLAAALGFLFIGSPFLRYVIGNYFLSTVIAEFFVLLLLGKTAQLLRTNEPRKWTSVVWLIAPYHLLLFFTYPPLYVIGTGLQVGFVLLSLLLFDSDRSDASNSLPQRAQVACKWVLAIVASSLIPMILDPQHAREMLRLLFVISDKQTFGWPLDLISPAAIFGLPAPLQVHRRNFQILNVIALTLLFVAIFFFARRAKGKSNGRLVFLLLSALSFLLYFAYFFRSGPSYQQWKIASYLPLFLAPFALASVASLLTANGERRHAALILGSLGPVFLGLNIAYHYIVEHPLDEFPSSYANLRALDMIGRTNDVYIDMSSMSSTFFPVYFLQSKVVHLLSPSYYTQETLSPEKITPATPLFVEGDACAADANAVTIAGVGCLYFRAPGLKMGADYPLGKNIPGLFVSYGVGGVEPWGRWSNGKRLKMRLLLDSGFTSTDTVRYLNLHVYPFPAANAGVQNVKADWGSDEKSEIVVRQPEWISIPFRKSDLSGFQDRMLSLELELPNATSPNSLDPLSGDLRELGLGLTDLSITEAPLNK
jgi:hypothetical protein